MPMAVNKVVYGTTVLVDLTGDTVNADGLLQGLTAHGANGEAIAGTLIPGFDIAPYKDIEVGELTPASNMSSISIDASKGTPAFISVICIDRNSITATSSSITAAFWTQDMNGTVVRVMRYYSNNNKQTTSNNYGTYTNGVFSLNYQLKAGWTYHYCVMYK